MKKQFTNKARYLGLKLTAIIFALLLFVSGQSWGQVTIASQDFEITPATPTISFSNTNGAYYTGSSASGDRVASSPFYSGGARSFGCNATSTSAYTSTLTFANQTGLGSYVSKYIQFRLAAWSIGSTGNGADAADIVTVAISTDGGTTWSNELRVLGSSANNAYWSYSGGTGIASVTYDGNNTPLDFQPTTSGNQTTNGFSTMKVILPDVVTQVSLKITMVNNATAERWTIDDLTLVGTLSGSTPPTLTADASNNNVDNNIDITFPTNGTWEAAVTAVKIGGTALAAGDYTLSAGNLQLKPSNGNSLLTTSGSKSVTIVATGYSDATVTQQIDAGAPAKLVMKTQPTAPASNGAALATQPAVYIQDQYGNATTSTANVVAAVGAGTWTLGGTTSVAAVAGTTTFSGLTATSATAVTGATISFTSGSLTGVTSGTFNIPAPPTPEPSNHATTFEAVLTTPTISNIILSWDDATGGQLPDGYLIKGSNVAYSSITDPVDGTAEADGGLVKNVAQGVQIHEFTGLSSGTTYFFKIYPYTNGGTSINYKTDGTIPQISIATDVAVTTPVAIAAEDITNNSFTAKWNSAVGATSYRLDVSSVTSGGNMSDLIISEYVEGSSNNKAIEIYNGTGASIDLSNYSLKKQANGAGVFGNEYLLTGTLSNNSTYVISHSSAVQSLLDLANVTTSTAIITFNGNDAIALYKNGVQIDVVGIVDQVTPDWGANLTLVRKSNVISPTVNYAITDWNSSTVDNFTNLGSHTFSGGSTITPLPSFTNLTVNTTSQSITGLDANTNYKYVVRGYGANGASSNSNEINVTTNKATESIASDANWSSLSNVGAGTNVTIPTGVVLTVNANASCAGITIENGGKLTINNPLTTQLVSIEEGGSLIDNDGTKQIPALAAKNIAGNASAPYWQWHFLSAPVVNQPITGTGNFIEFTSPSVLNPDIDFYRFDPDAAQPWINIKDGSGNLNTSFGTPSGDPEFVVGMGYLVSYNSSNTPTTFAGNLNTGDANITLVANKFNLIGNPFPSAINWGNVNRTSLTSQHAWIYDGDLSDYVVVSTGTIAPMQGFFIEAGASATFAIPNSVRTHDASTFLKTTSTNTNEISLKFSNGSKWGTTRIQFLANATTGKDWYDALKLFSMNTAIPQVYTTISTGQKFAVNALPELNANTTVPVGIYVPANGNYTISADGLANFSHCTSITLEDLKTNTTQNLMQNPVYSFTAATTDNANRFVLHFATAVGVNEIGNSNGGIYAYDNSIYVNANEQIKQISVYNAMGQLVKTLSNVNGLQKINMNGNATGYYIVRVVSDKNVYSEKVLIK